ncbi:hypothetical protein J2803_001759 [Paraburkholderia phenoliruptrix]|nr:hypothetical protein [Paraburkholderia phenoliruptrix]
MKLIERLRDRARQFFGHVDGRGAASEEMKQAAALIEQQAARIAEFERILDGLSQDAIDGGWTARGISAYAKTLEDQIAALESAAKGEPIAWRWKGIDDDWRYSVHKLDESAEPLYTAPAATDNGGGHD